MSILEAYNMPFAAALLAMLVLAVVQIIGVADLFGDADVEVGHDVSAHADVSGSLFDGLFSVIGLGRIPLMVWLSLIHKVMPCRNVPTPSVTISE